MHVCVLPSWYPEDSSDISGCFFREQAIALSKYNIKVGVIFPKVYGIRHLKDYRAALNKESIEIDHNVLVYRGITLSYIPKMHSAYAFFFVKEGMRLFEKYVEDNGYPDILHVHSLLYAGCLALKINKKYKIPYVVTEHSTAFERDTLTIQQQKLALKAAKQAKNCIAVSLPFSELLNDYFSNQINWVVVPNILSSLFENSTLFGNALPNKEFVFCNASLLTSKKGVDILLQAFSLAFSGEKKVKLKIAGDGQERSRLQALAQSLNVNQQVEFLGMQSRDQVLSLMVNSNVYVLSSHVETFGVVVIESLALGRPVIATKCGGPESIVSDGDGLLVEKNNPKKLAEAMISLYENYNEFKPVKIRDNCLARFSEAVVVKTLVEKYKNALKM